MKNTLKRILCGMATTAVMITSSALMLCVTVSATKTFKPENDRAWYLKYWWQDFSSYTVDTKNVYGDSPYSIVIKNIDYNNTYLSRTFDVKPDTHYRFSAAVKYSGYKLIEDADYKELSGAAIGLTEPWDMRVLSEFVRTNKWKTISCEFVTEKDQTTVGLSLYNSYSGCSSRGTAWFSDIKLEECIGTDQQDKVNSDYLLVSDDMTPGENITVKGALPTHISALSISKIKDKYYSGKEIKPSVTVKGAVKGTDYTVTYKNCNSVGRASVIINGKDKYTGTVELTFNIKLKKTTAKKNDSTLTWAKVPGADGYEIYYSTGSKYKKLADMGVSTSYDLTKLKSGSYILAVRAYKKTPYGVIYGDLSEGVNVKK